MSHSYANFAHYVKDTAWFDELELAGWDTLKKYSQYTDYAELIADAQHNTSRYIHKHYSLSVEEATALCNAIEVMYKDFHEKTSLSLEAQIMYDEYDLDDIEKGLQFLVYGVRNLTLPGMKAIDAGKITSGSWVSGC